MRLRVLFAVLALAVCAVTAEESTEGDKTETGVAVLTERCYWRQHYERGMMRLSAEALKAESGKLIPEALLKRLEKDTQRYLEGKNIDWTTADWRDAAVVHFLPNEPDDTGAVRAMVSWPPPPNWSTPDFDDSGWLRQRIKPLAYGRPQYLSPPGMFNRAIYLRSSFDVPDLAQARDLVLKMKYRGGVRVLVNGSEVARAHLPEGELTTETKATDYPEDAYRSYIDECNEPHLGRRCIPDLRFSWEEAPKGTGATQNFRDAYGGTWINEKGYKRMMKARDRELGPVTVPAMFLKKGSNSVAIEIHGSHYHPIVYPGAGSERFASGNWSRPGAMLVAWEHARLINMELRDPSGALPSMAQRPEAAKVWVEDMHTRTYQNDYGQASEPAGTMRFIGAQNGTYSGQAIVATSDDLGAVSARASDLKGDKGSTIPASELAVSYLVPQPLAELVKNGYGRGDERAALTPVTIDAVYYASNNPAIFKAVPGRALVTEMEKTQYYDQICATAPEAVRAMTCQPVWVRLKIPPDAAPGKYKGTLTIEAMGMKTAEVPLEAEVIGWRVPNPQEFQTDIGMEQSPYALARHYKTPFWSPAHFKLIEASFQQMARAGADTLYIPVLQRTEFGNIEDPPMIKWILKKDKSLAFDYTVLDRYLDLAVKHLGKPRVISFVIMHYMMASSPPRVAVFNEETGNDETVGVGWKEEAFQRIPMWKSFAMALYEHLKSKGLEKSIRWGHGGDVESDPALIALMFDLFPETYWTAAPHSYNGGAGGGGHNRRVFRVVSEIYGRLFRAESYRGWKKEDETYINPLCIRNFGGGISLPFLFRAIPDRAIHMGYTGVGRMGFDYFDFTWLQGYQGTDWCPPGIPIFQMAYAGKNGAESSARYEAFVEGIQEAEARIFVEQCLDRNILPMDLAKEAQAIVYDNTWSTVSPQFGPSQLSFFTNGWQDRSRKLYGVASRIAGVVGLDVEKTAFTTSVPALGKNTLSIKLRNWTSQPRPWKAATPDKWIIPARMDGSLAGMEELVVTLDGSAGEPGKELAGALTITDAASGLAFSIKITATVMPPVEFLFDHPHFNVSVGQKETRDFRIVNRAATEQPWTLAASVPWLVIEPASGKLAPGQTVFINITSTPPGAESIVHENTLTFTASNGLFKLPVLSKTFVIPPYKAPASLPLGRKIEIDKVDAKRVTAHGCCMRKTVTLVGQAYRGGWGSPFAAKPTHSATYAHGSSRIILLLGTQKFERGMWVTPHHETAYNLEGSGYREFSAYVGMPREVGKVMIRDFNRKINFEIHVDGKIQAQTGLMGPFDEPRLLVARNLENAKEIKLVTRLDSDGDNGTFVSAWADAMFWSKE